MTGTLPDEDRVAAVLRRVVWYDPLEPLAWVLIFLVRAAGAVFGGLSSLFLFFFALASLSSEPITALAFLCLTGTATVAFVVALVLPRGAPIWLARSIYLLCAALSGIVATANILALLVRTIGRYDTEASVGMSVAVFTGAAFCVFGYVLAYLRHATPFPSDEGPIKRHAQHDQQS